MATLRIKQYQNENGKWNGCALQLEASFSEVYSVKQDVIRGLPRIAAAFGIREPVRQVREDEINRELYRASH